ncbi:hypothetical protein O3P69_008644 [Scylla paramamosain]|uniref:Uncharacterized protein n=1 Tax=Scylla paramamosain TaxID=85552 RepID=A0AAW0SL27_SCYPA
MMQLASRWDPSSNALVSATSGTRYALSTRILGFENSWIRQPLDSEPCHRSCRYSRRYNRNSSHCRSCYYSRYSSCCHGCHYSRYTTRHQDCNSYAFSCAPYGQTCGSESAWLRVRPSCKPTPPTRRSGNGAASGMISQSIDLEGLPREKHLIEIRMSVSLEVQRTLEHTLRIVPNTQLAVEEVLDVLQSHFKSQRKEALRYRGIMQIVSYCREEWKTDVALDLLGLFEIK